MKLMQRAKFVAQTNNQAASRSVIHAANGSSCIVAPLRLAHDSVAKWLTIFCEEVPVQSQQRARGMRLIDLTSVQLGSSETARRINRDIVLELIRARQSLSRADLSRLSGLQRSTVSLIVEQLIEEKWVCEGSVTRSE